ncbi:fibronectin type III domain-containing protein [Geofilum sp. OHC36d9]|uniref:fibronectin type III domain-containing protein n=1 Tax=Geofilum sp. OHC36d9 TaxID=3458413 RepID=UPI00403367DB
MSHALTLPPVSQPSRVVVFLFFSFFLFFYFVAIFESSAQTAGVKVLGSPRDSAILLRWAPSSPAVWRLGNQYGYMVERYTVLRDGQIPDTIEGLLLLNDPVHPQPLEKWEPFADDKYVSIAAECLFHSLYKGISSGGNPHVVYQMYKEEQHRYSFAMYAADQSLVAAGLSGLYMTDASVRPNEKYLYRVFISCPDSLAVDTGSVFTGLSEFQPLPRPQPPVALWDDKKVSLSWNIFYLNHIYSSYVLERSGDDGNTFDRVSDNAMVQLTDDDVSAHYMYHTDTLPDNQTVFYYRVRGVSAFGELGPPSDSIYGSGRRHITRAPVVVNKEVIDNKQVRLTWEYPADMNPYITGFKVYRSTGPKTHKKVVLNGRDPQQRFFTDSMPDMTNYYLVSVYDETGEMITPETIYAARVDSFPPVAPVGLTGKVDSLGVVTISWLPNGETDLQGYRVYMSNHPSFEYLLATPSVVNDTVFRDFVNIHTLTRFVYYKVTAIDVRENQSSFSESLELQRPDVIAPVAPRLLSVSETKEGVALKWVNSSSDDVANHSIYRKKASDTLFVRLANLSDTREEISIYQDQTAVKGDAYSYYVIAEDESGLLSPASNQGFIRLSGDSPEGIQLSFVQRIDRVILQWNITCSKKVARVVVYRSEGDKPMRLYGNSVEDVFVDAVLSPGTVYKYRANAVYTDGSVSPMSLPVTVEF